MKEEGIYLIEEVRPPSGLCRFNRAVERWVLSVSVGARHGGRVTQ
jgi:hypothetical protein